MRRRILLAALAAAGAVFMGALGGCRGAPWGCLSLSDASAQLPPAEAGGTAPASRELLDRALDAILARADAIIAKGGRGDSLIQAAMVSRIYESPRLRDFLTRYPKEIAHPNWRRAVWEESPTSPPLCIDRFVSETDCIALQAIHCDRVPPQPDLLSRIQQNATKQGTDFGYHALWALGELQNRKCLDPAEVGGAIDRVAAPLVGVLDEQLRRGSLPTPGAVAMLDYAGRPELVNPRWVQMYWAEVKQILAAPETIDPHEHLFVIYVLAHEWPPAQGGMP